MMEKSRSSPFSVIFPWLAPLVIKFALVANGIEVQLYRNDRLLQNWQPARLRHVLPPQLIQWIEANHIYAGPQPYPLIKQFWQNLAPLASKKLLVDASALAGLQEMGQPPDFALIWSIDYSQTCIAGHYQGAERYLGMGWFQRSTKIWALRGSVSPALDARLKNLRVPIEQAEVLVNSVIPELRQYLLTYTDFRIVTNFAVRVLASEVRSEQLTLTIECNDPQLLPVLQIPQRSSDILLARQALLRFPRQALTPALRQLLHQSPSITIRGPAIPQFISDQLPIMRRSEQISDAMTAEITRLHPIVSIATLRPVSRVIRRFENGVGRYSITATYPYQQHDLDMEALLAAHQRNQRFVQQHGVWFEWPANSYELARTILQTRAAQPLRAEEVMGFDTRRIALAHNRPDVETMLPAGATPAARAQSLFNQLRDLGAPGGIVGEPAGLASMFIEACREIVGAGWQASVLWLTPSNKKGSVTRALHKSLVGSHVTVASLVTLRDEPALCARSWTLVIFQELDGLLDGSPQSRMLPQLRWQWALVSVTSQQAMHPSIIHVLHLPEQYYEQFRARFLFDVEKSYQRSPTSSVKSVLKAAQPAAHAVPGKEAEAGGLARNNQPKQPPAPPVLTPPTAGLKEHLARPSARPGVRASAQTDSADLRSGKVAQPARPRIDLNQQKIAHLREESEQLRERLGFGTEEEEQEQPFPKFAPEPEPLPATPEPALTAEAAPGVDEDWQLILQQWRPEHWEALLCLCQGQADQLDALGRRVHRPASQLIDEINAPVDEQLGDLLIDAEARTIFSHWHATAEELTRWYSSSKDRELFS